MHEARNVRIPFTKRGRDSAYTKRGSKSKLYEAMKISLFEIEIKPDANYPSYLVAKPKSNPDYILGISHNDDIRKKILENMTELIVENINIEFIKTGSYEHR